MPHRTNPETDTAVQMCEFKDLPRSYHQLVGALRKLQNIWGESYMWDMWRELTQKWLLHGNYVRWALHDEPKWVPLTEEVVGMGLWAVAPKTSSVEDFVRPKRSPRGFPGGTSGREQAYQCRRRKKCRFDPGSGRSPGGGHGNPLQYSCLENPMDRGAWWATVHRVAQSQTELKQLSRHASKRILKDVDVMIHLSPSFQTYLRRFSASQALAMCSSCSGWSDEEEVNRTTL